MCYNLLKSPSTKQKMQIGENGSLSTICCVYTEMDTAELMIDEILVFQLIPRCVCPNRAINQSAETGIMPQWHHSHSRGLFVNYFSSQKRLNAEKCLTFSYFS